MTTKLSNPKDIVGSLKLMWSVIPWGVIAELALAMLEGLLKYGRHNYRVVGVRASVYFDAADRHMKAWWEGEDLDPDSGLSHIIKAMACLTVLRDSMLAGNWVDDRPPVTMAPGWITEMNKKVVELIERYPNPPAPFTQAGVNDGLYTAGGPKTVGNTSSQKASAAGAPLLQAFYYASCTCYACEAARKAGLPMRSDR